jgi:hypothetical protein
MDKFHCVFREVWGVARLVAKKAREVLDWAIGGGANGAHNGP